MFSLFAQIRKLFGASTTAEEATDRTETESIETTQTDTSYSKEPKHQHESMPAPTPSWTLPLCGPLLNRLFLSKKDVTNSTTTTNLDSTSTLCECARDGLSEKDDDFVLIDSPSTKEDSAPESADSSPANNNQQPPSSLPTIKISSVDEGRGRKVVMYLTEDIDKIILPTEIAFLAHLLQSLKNGVAGDAPIRPSTKDSGRIIKTRAQRWANTVAGAVDRQVRKEEAKVERIRREKEEAQAGEKKVDGEDVD